jgi:GH25 family lysozyme M1 (1,4-beta-N-acetylmuramidase)
MRTFQQAKAFAIGQHNSPTQSWHNLCQLFSRQCVGAGSFGASARLAFNAIPSAAKHTSWPPPPGSIAYYGHHDRGFGHAVFVVEAGFVWSNDILRRGGIDRVRWDVFQREWGLPYRGWITACPSGRLPISADQPTASFRQGGRVYASKLRFRQTDSDSVWNLQLALMDKGYSVGAGPTGTFGPHTLAACAAFQGAQGWRGHQADGIPGPTTIRRLGLLWVDDADAPSPPPDKRRRRANKKRVVEAVGVAGAGQPGELVVHGADLSHHNADPALIKARDAGLMFVYHKATEGTTVQDRKYPARRSAARKAGVAFGAYHFASPDRDDAVAEARAFIEYADPEAGDLAPALDMEVRGSERLEAWSSEFMAEVSRLLTRRGLRPSTRLVHYGPDDYGADYPYLRWVPRYNDANKPPAARFDIWQFSNGKLGRPRSFPGLPGAVDLNTMRAGLELDALLLRRIGEGDPTPDAVVARAKAAKGPSDAGGDLLACAHASLEFSDTPAQHTADIEKIFAHEKARGARWITGTEAGRGATNTNEELARIGRAHGYAVFLPSANTDCWVAVAEDFIEGQWTTGYIKVIGSSRDTGDPHRHAERGVVWVQFATSSYGTISVAAAHHLTHGRSPGAEQHDEPGDPVDHFAENKKLSKAIADWALERSAGRNLAFFGGDTNMGDKSADVFFGAPLTTLWDELKKWPDTGHGTIDVIASCDNDRRVIGKSCRALDDEELALHMDHFLVDGEFLVRPLRSGDQADRPR